MSTLADLDAATARAQDIADKPFAIEATYKGETGNLRIAPVNGVVRAGLTFDLHEATRFADPEAAEKKAQDIREMQRHLFDPRSALKNIRVTRVRW